MSTLTPGKEYERKFLVRADLFSASQAKREARKQSIRQGYLVLEPAQVRIREADGTFTLEIKGEDDLEIECGTLEPAYGRALLETYAPRVAGVIEKDRWRLPAGFDDLAWEVDVFRGDNAPLVVAEIEMPRKHYPLLGYRGEREWPEWLSSEVTDDPRFKNKNLAVMPFQRWPKREQKKILKLMGV